MIFGFYFNHRNNHCRIGSFELADGVIRNQDQYYFFTTLKIRLEHMKRISTILNHFFDVKIKDLIESPRETCSIALSHIVEF